MKTNILKTPLRISELGSALFLVVALVFGACGGDSSSDVVTGACPGGCGFGQECNIATGMCQFIGGNSNGATDTGTVEDTGNAEDTGGNADADEDASGDTTEADTLEGDTAEGDTNDTGEEDTSEGDDAGDVPMMGCGGDEDCENIEYCAIADGDDEGECTEGCRENGCPGGQLCNLDTRMCEENSNACTSEDDCDDGFVCNIVEGEDEGECIEACTDDDDCPGQTCDTEIGFCVSAGCDVPGDCSVGFFCDDRTDTCEPGCDAQEDCGVDSGQVCDERDNICVGAPCGDNDACGVIAPVCDLEEGVCVPGCLSDDACGFGEICDEMLNACRLGCREDGVCQLSEYCDATELLCLVGCRDNASCEDGFECTEISVDEGEGLVQRQRCTEILCEGDTDCQDTAYCALPDGACVEGCRINDDDTDNCNDGLVCDAETRFCVDAPCVSSDDCLMGEFCSEESCIAGCDDDARCPAAQPCNLDTNTCGCITSDDCALDQICSLGECIARCNNDDACADGFFCDAEVGLCTEGCRDDDSEPNNTRQTATPIDPGSYAQRMCYEAMIGTNYLDCYSVLLAEDDAISVALTFTHSDGDLDLQLYDPIDQLARLGNSLNNNESVEYVAEFEGIHVICVQPQGLGFESNYGMDVTITPAAGCLNDIDEADGNNTCEEVAGNAVDLQVGEPTIFADRTICEGDDDFTAVNLRSGQELTVTMERTSPEGELEVEIYNTNCTRLLSSGSIDATRSITLEAPGDGVYTVRVFGELADEEGAYDLTLELGSGSAMCPPGDVVHGSPTGEHNNVGSAAQLLPENIMRNSDNVLEGLTLCSAQEDWYAVGLPIQANDVLQVSLEQSAGEVPLMVELIDTDGATVLSGATSMNGSAQAETDALAVAGTYYIRVSSSEAIGMAGVLYELNVAVMASGGVCPDDMNEPNDNIDEATLVIEDAPFDGTLCREMLGEADWYAFELGPGDALNPIVTFTVPDGVTPGLNFFPQILLRSPTGEMDSLFDLEGDNTYELLLGEKLIGNDAGLWTLSIQGAVAGAATEYTVDLSIDALTCEERISPDQLDLLSAYEDNGNCDNATGLSLDPGDMMFYTPEAYVCGPDSDEDWFSITVAEGAQLTVALTHFHDSGNLDVEMYDPTGTLVDTSFNAGGGCDASGVPPEFGPDCESVVDPSAMAGQYCVRVFARSGLTQNAFMIRAGVQ